MGPETSLFTVALGLQAPWSVTELCREMGDGA